MIIDVPAKWNIIKHLRCIRVKWIGWIEIKWQKFSLLKKSIFSQFFFQFFSWMNLHTWKRHVWSIVQWPIHSKGVHQFRYFFTRWVYQNPRTMVIWTSLTTFSPSAIHMHFGRKYLNCCMPFECVSKWSTLIASFLIGWYKARPFNYQKVSFFIIHKGAVEYTPSKGSLPLMDVHGYLWR